MLGTLPYSAGVSKRSLLGAVYTTELLAAWAARLLDSMMGRRVGTVVDPACGDGALLSAIRSQGYSDVAGIDCDAQALKRASRNLPGVRLDRDDGLQFLASAARNGGSLDGVIANPPWGAQLRIDRDTLRSLGYRVLSGQTDSWDLFVDGIIRALKPSAPAVLILPDALFLPEHRAIREILTRDTHITMIARLGEGFFSGVYRGTVVVGLRKGPPKRQAVVSCARLSPTARKQVLSGVCSLSSVIDSVAHRVPQRRFALDPELRFDIDSREGDRQTLAALDERQFPWDDWFNIGRGIELSKSGRVVRCPKCSEARPIPREGRAICVGCSHKWSPSDSAVETIVRHNDGVPRRGWYPLIVGEDVDRYNCVASRVIRAGVPGIRYKSLDGYQAPKLLIRKTGIGIKAAMDFSGSTTNQVVFHVTCRAGVPVVLLDYMAGVLCSRVMLAWHLKRHGEVEWRSHPYITPQMIRHFPVPVPVTEDDWAQVGAISSAVRARRNAARHDSPEDFLVERLVAGMYGLGHKDMRWVLDVLESAQQLEPIRTLLVGSVSLVTPLRARGVA